MDAPNGLFPIQTIEAASRDKAQNASVSSFPSLIDSGYGTSASDTDSQSETTLHDIPLPPEPKPAPKVLDLDLKTPDAHVARDPRLIRLTGVHPFNVEAPLSDLYNEGFLTSPDLFYVRNHGAVPECRDEDALSWEFEVCGEVARPFKITLRDMIQRFEQITCPATLVCAGNRRKEQNVVRKSKGFSWGPAGLSTALWTGCMMADVIRAALPTRRARYVCMEGADKLPNGYYGTSVKLNWVLDPNRGIMLAHGMNGEMLRPDHGKPLRALIPGQIGGRSVKWLKKLIVTSEPSDNWYHFYDNRVLPTMVSPEESAANPDWWKDERYAIYDLGVNSATAFPAHDERLSLPGASDDQQEQRKYRVKGYAYSGGGKKITRVELSLDRGKTWKLTEVDYPEDRYREVEMDIYNSRLDTWWREASHCWCFWSLDVPVADLADSKDMVVRAMDESMQVQPRDMYWSVLGMMNNPWFRIVIHKEGDSLRFEHPTQPALMPGGWMERIKKAGGNLTNGFWGESIGGVGEEPAAAAGKEEAVKEISLIKADLKREISIEELRQHEGEEEPWFVLKGEVYDGTPFLSGHPGGAQSIFSAAGMDCSDEFMAIHSETAKAMMPDYHIGTLSASAQKALAEGDPNAVVSSEPRPVFLQPKAWTKATLSVKRIVSWDTRIFTFTLEHPEQRLGLPTGQHLMMRLQDAKTQEMIIRAYTPISEQSDVGTVDVLIKVYFDQPNGVAGGRLSQAIDALPLGASVDFKGPIGKFEYLGGGQCLVQGQQRHVDRFLMICGGSGVTPVYQVFRAVMRDSEDPTLCVLLDGNRLVEDILCREELDALARQGQGRGKVVYTLTQPPETWTGLRGRVCGDLVRQHCPRGEKEEEEECEGGEGSREKTMVLVCGPEAMEKSMRKTLLEDGWSEDDLLFF